MAIQEKNHKPGIVILGAPRSGTTLLRRLFNAHPHIACPPETNLLGGCARFLHEEEFGEGLATGVVPGLGFSGFAERDILDRLRNLAFGILSEIAADNGKPRWAEKTAFDAFHIDEIERLCADQVRYVCILRHGLDVSVSIEDLCNQMGCYVSELHRYIQRYPFPLEAFAHAWVDVSERILGLAVDHPDTCLIVRYEDLISDTTGQLSRIFEFLDEKTNVERLLAHAFGDIDNPGLGDWKTYQHDSISSGSIGRWESLGTMSKNRLAPIVNPTLKSAGYQPVTVHAPLSREDAQRRMQLELLAARMKLAKKPTGKGS